MSPRIVVSAIFGFALGVVVTVKVLNVFPAALRDKQALLEENRVLKQLISTKFLESKEFQDIFKSGTSTPEPSRPATFDERQKRIVD